MGLSEKCLAALQFPLLSMQLLFRQWAFGHFL